MFPKLSCKSFIKHKPDSHIYALFKDGVRNALVVNNSASSILELCDGSNSIEDIISILKEKYNSDIDMVRKNVKEFLDPLIKSGLIEDVKLLVPQDIVRGDVNTYYPDIIIWEITDYCPLKCRHCYLEGKNNNSISKNDIDKILKLIDNIGVYQIQITGGEALTHPYFEYIICQLIDRGIIVSVSTSGIISSDNILKCLNRLKEVKGSFIRVSLDGNKNTHNYIRRNDTSYNSAVEFIKKICNANIQCQVGTVVINQDEKELEELTVMVRELGVSLIEIGLVMTIGNAYKNNLDPSIKPKRFNQFLHELSNKYSSENFIVKLPCETVQENCGSGHKIIRIKPNMDITPCPTAEIILGNLYKQSISEIMMRCGEIFHDFLAPCKEFCQNCENEYACKNCMAQGFNFKNKVKKCTWFENQNKILKDFINT